MGWAPIYSEAGQPDLGPPPQAQPRAEVKSKLGPQRRVVINDKDMLVLRYTVIKFTRRRCWFTGIGIAAALGLGVVMSVGLIVIEKGRSRVVLNQGGKIDRAARPEGMR